LGPRGFERNSPARRGRGTGSRFVRCGGGLFLIRGL